MKCPICNKEYKGKIGVGVHLKRGHTPEERRKYYINLRSALLPTIMTIAFLFGAIKAGLVGKKSI